MTHPASAPNTPPGPRPLRPNAFADGETGAIAPQARSLWRYLRMHGASPTEADDLVQEAFVVALQKDALGIDTAARWTFLQRTARFLFLRHRKAGRNGERLADAVDELWARDCGTDHADALVAATRACVEQLDGRARTAVEMSYGFDQTAQSRSAIATALGMQENGVKTLLQRVRKILRECIDRRLGR